LAFNLYNFRVIYHFYQYWLSTTEETKTESNIESERVLSAIWI